jgi:uncharacterized protein (DUF849 family)
MNGSESIRTLPQRRRFVLVKSCLNGPRTRAEHKRVPITPREFARDAKEVVRAGAAAVHLHPRLPDGDETLEANACGEAIKAIRGACRVPLGISTASWIEENPARKVSFIDGWKVNPDFASVNLNEAGWRDVCKALVRRGVWIEAGLWSVADARTFVSSGFEKGCVRVLVEITEKEPAEAVSLAAEMDRVLRKAKGRLPILHHGYDRTAWRVLENALELGRDIRVGLEDTLFLPNGRPAGSNARLVESAVRMLRKRGLAPMGLT